MRTSRAKKNAKFEYPPKNPKSEYRNPKQIRMGGQWGKMRKPTDLLTLPENGAKDVHQLRGFIEQGLPKRGLVGISISVDPFFCLS